MTSTPHLVRWPIPRQGLPLALDQRTLCRVHRGIGNWKNTPQHGQLCTALVLIAALCISSLNKDTSFKFLEGY